MAGNDRFTAVGQWIRLASQADLARLDPRTLARDLLGGRPGRRRGGRRIPASVRGYRTRHAQALAQGRLRAVAVEGKTWPC